MEKELLTTTEAAEFLGYSPGTLNTSRSTGRLAGVESPVFLKIGSAVRYEKADLNKWVDENQSLAQ